MDTSHDAPSSRLPRVPLGELTVELLGDQPGEVFEADGVNLGRGGIALRAPILPEVGARLACAFESPLDGRRIHAECEVVWAADQGPNLGEFGLRFDRVDGESADALDALVEAEDRLLTADEALALGWAPPPSPPPSSEGLDSDEGSLDDATVALALDGVGSELVAELRELRDDLLVAEQELPFLTLGTGLTTEDGRRGVLSSVDLRVVDGVPRLVLTVLFDEAEPAAGRTAAFADALDDGRSDEARDARVPARAELAPHLALDDVDAPEDALDGEAPDTIPDAKTTAQVQPAAPISKMRAVGEPVVERASHVAVAVREATEHGLEKAMPAVRETLDRVKDGALRVTSHLPDASEAARTTLTTVKRFAGLLRARLAQPAESPAASRPAKRVQRRPDEPPAAPAPSAAASAESRAFRGRHVLLLAVAALVLGMGIRSLSRATDEPAVQVPPRATEVSAAPAQDAPPSATAAPITASPAAVAPASTAAPTPAGGPLPPPTFPTMERPAVGGSAVSAAPVAPAPAAEPAAAEAAPVARHFGAASVPGAMPFDLQMTLPVARVEGEVTPTGIRVVFYGSNSLSRASPIAAAHPGVDRASIFNRGDHAELTLDWKGAAPTYRVEASGTRVRILLGTR